MTRVGKFSTCTFKSLGYFHLSTAPDTYGPISKEANSLIIVLTDFSLHSRIKGQRVRQRLLWNITMGKGMVTIFRLGYC